MMSNERFELMRWDAPEPPSEALLMRLMQRESLTPERRELMEGSHSPEMKFPQQMVRVLISGLVQVALPGYGTVDLEPGDILEIQPDVLHDLTVTGHQPAIMLEAVRSK